MYTKPKKRFGQHFLHDRHVIQRIIDKIQELVPEDYRVFEIGPGQGVLSYPLKKLYPDLKLIEIDRDMIPGLLEVFPEEEVLNIDFLKVNMADYLRPEHNAIVGNYPYNISTQIIFKILDFREMIETAVGMFQLEVAQRLAADSGNKQYGVSTVLTQAIYDVKLHFRIAPGSFNPAPKVQSAIISLHRKPESEWPTNYTLFRKVVKMSFSQRRKKMRNTLKPLIQDDSLEILQQRPEQLSVQDFKELTDLIESRITQEEE